MYENFTFDDKKRIVAGYHYPVEQATHVMCLIHGVGEHAGRYRRMADQLGKSGIAVLSMDLRGHGISKGERGDTAPRKEILSDVDALIEKAQSLYPQRPITLYGHSMGGNICLDYRARGKDNAVPEKYIVSAPWVKLVRPVPKPLYGFVVAASKVLPKKAISQSFPEKDLGNLEYVRPYNDDPLVHNRITLRTAVECFDLGNALYQGTNEDNHRSDGKPFLLMHGDADKICSVEGSRKIAERLADRDWFTYVEWPGYCHEIHNGGLEATGDEVIEKIKEFILQ